MSTQIARQYVVYFVTEFPIHSGNCPGGRATVSIGAGGYQRKSCVAAQCSGATVRGYPHGHRFVSTGQPR